MIVIGCIEHSSYLAGDSMESDINSNDKSFEWQQTSSKVIWNFVFYFMFVCQRTLRIAFFYFIFSTTQPTYYRTLSCLSYANQSNIADNLSADIKVDLTKTSTRHFNKHPTFLELDFQWSLFCVICWFVNTLTNYIIE